MAWIYVLKCARGKYYVGMTKRTIGARCKEHSCGVGSNWTNKYPIIDQSPIQKVLCKQEEVRDIETKCTIHYMSIYGIDNVRGGVYHAVELSPGQVKEINDEITRLRADSRYKK